MRFIRVLECKVWSLGFSVCGFRYKVKGLCRQPSVERAKSFRVRNRNSSSFLRGSHKKMPEMCRRLGFRGLGVTTGYSKGALGSLFC